MYDIFLKHKDLKRRHRESVWKEHLIRKINATIILSLTQEIKNKIGKDKQGVEVQNERRRYNREPRERSAS